MNNVIARFLLALIFTLVSACSTSVGISNLQNGNKLATYEWHEQSDQLTIPFDWHHGHIIIPVSINGGKPLRLAFDSGASVTVLFESIRTRQLNLNVERQITLNGSGKTVNVANGATVGLAGLELKNLTVLHVPLNNSPIFSSIEETYFDGAIGYDLLSRFTVKIDYPNQLITLWEPSTEQPDTSAWEALPIDISTRVPYIQVLLNKDLGSTRTSDAAAVLLVDTGAPFYLYVDPEMHTALEIPAQYYETTGHGFNGPFHRYTGRQQQLTVGDHNFYGIATHFEKGNFDDLKGIGLLGNALLKNFDLVFDYSSKNLMIKKNQQFNVESELDKSGLHLLPHSNGAVILSVAPKTGAYLAGLKAHNVITHFNQQRINQSNYDEFKAILSSDQGSVDLCWIADEKDNCGLLALSPRNQVE